jgi:hypothetical protein
MFDQFKEPKHEIVTVKKEDSQEASSAISETFRRIALGSVKKKVIIRIEGEDK